MRRDNFADARSADDFAETSALNCAATGCPNRWSVSRGGDRGLCSAHAWSQPHRWPEITREQQDAHAMRAYRGDRDDCAPPLTRAEKVALLSGLRGVGLGSQDPRGWAVKLRDCELERDGILPNGRRMTQFQRDAWRRVLNGFATEGADA